MRKINGEFVASRTDKKRAQSRVNRLAREAAYNGTVEAWLNNATGTIHYIELAGLEFVAEHEGYTFLAAAESWGK